MPARFVPVRGRGLCGLAALVVSTLLAVPLHAEAPTPQETLSIGEIRERPIKADEAHEWRVLVAPGTSLLVTVDQHSIALIVEARGPEDREPIAVHAGDRWGPEVLLLKTAGEFRITVRPRDKGVWPGKYTIGTDILLEGKSDRRDALTLMSRAGQETVKDTPESRSQAVALYRQALETWRSLKDLAREAETLSCIAILEANSSDLRAATEDFQNGLKLWKELAKAQREAETLSFLGNIYKDTQEIAKAHEPWEKALALWHDLDERFEEAEAQGNSCFLKQLRGDLLEALACYQDNLAFFREHGIASHEALILSNIGGVYDNQGEPNKALASLESALSIHHALGDRYSEAETLNSIAKVHRTLGEWQEALRIYEQARVVLEPLGDRDTETRLFNNIGVVYNGLGQPERALPYLEKGLELRREVGNRHGEVTSLNNIGSAWRKTGDLKKALAQHRKALKLAEALEDTAQQATSHLRLAEVYLDQADVPAALRDLDAALTLLRDKGNRLTETEVLHQKGRALAQARRAGEALPALQEVLARRRAVQDRAGEAETLYALADAERSLGLGGEARGHAQEAVSQVEKLRIGFASPDLRASFLATRERAYSLLIDLLMDQHRTEPNRGHDQEAFSVSERARARSLLDALRDAAAGHAGSTVPAELLAQRRVLLRSESEKVDQRWKQSGAEAEALETEIVTILGQIDAVEAKIRRSDRRLASLSPPEPVGPKEISGWLEPGTMLLEYSLGEDRSFLWTVDAGGLQSFVLPRRSTIETLARRVYKELSTVESGSAHRGEAAEALSKILLGPLWSDRSSAARLQRLVVVPDGGLGILPFAALPVPEPGKSWSAAGPHKPLLESLEVVSIPSATTLAVQRQRLDRRAQATKWAAVLADPVFAANDPHSAHRSPIKATTKASTLRGPTHRDAMALEPLPATRREAHAVASLAPPGLVWLGLGVEANREAVLSGSLRDFRILHFATHAVADTRNPELSGLFLSQVDAEGHNREGFLGLSDIYELDLDADLVVLSGCSTALGKEVRGEGLMGLTRGFQYAGVPRVVASLWQVQDRATAELMTRFYKAMWHDSLTPAAALREAQKSLRHDYRDPYYWAGFVLQGDWR